PCSEHARRLRRPKRWSGCRRLPRRLNTEREKRQSVAKTRHPSRIAPRQKQAALQELFEADAGTRTPDPFITSEVLYQLSYVGVAAVGGACATTRCHQCMLAAPPRTLPSCPQLLPVPRTTTPLR